MVMWEPALHTLAPWRLGCQEVGPLIPLASNTAADVGISRKRIYLCQPFQISIYDLRLPISSRSCLYSASD